jgi:hypothetical protein
MLRISARSAVIGKNKRRRIMKLPELYFSDALIPKNRKKMVKLIVKFLKGVDFDTIVCTGVSGLVIAPIIAHLMGKCIFVIRKEGEGCHSSAGYSGIMGSRFIILDDLVDSGQTLRRINTHLIDHDHANRDTPPVFVGTVMYQHEFTSNPVWYEDACDTFRQFSGDRNSDDFMRLEVFVDNGAKFRPLGSDQDWRDIHYSK